MSLPQGLVESLARELAAFQATRRGTERHIGYDMELCGGVNYGPIQRPCSARCVRVRLALQAAADYLAVPVEALDVPPAKPGRRPAQPSLEGV